MVSNIVKYSGVVALAILLFVGGSKLLTVYHVNFGTAVDCQSVTCFTTVGVLTSFQDDGTAIFNGAVTLASTLVTSSTLQIGTNGTALNRVNTGFCTIQSTATTIGAYATSTVSCQAATTGGLSPLTGITAGDSCQLGIATTTNTGGADIQVIGASASSTSGYIHAFLANMTGTSFSWSATASTSWPYTCTN